MYTKCTCIIVVKLNHSSIQDVWQLHACTRVLLSLRELNDAAIEGVLHVLSVI